MTPRLRRATGVASLLVCALACTVGCSSEADASGESSTDGGSRFPGPARTSCGDIPITLPEYMNRPAPADCVSCIEASCCAEAEACAAEPACKERRECFAPCGYSSACRSECLAEPESPQEADFNACVTSDCEKQCGAPDLGCVGQPQPAPSEPTRALRLQLVFFGSTTTPFDNTRVRVCRPDDMECTSPLSEATTDADGFVDLVVPLGPGGMNAYLELTGLAIAPSLLYSRYFDSSLVPSSARFQALDLPTFNALRSGLGAPDDSTRGMITASARSCWAIALPGITLASSNADADTIQVYAENNFPSATATMTDGRGVGAHFANHPAGLTTITATDAATGARHGAVEVVVRGGFTTSAIVVPSP